MYLMSSPIYKFLKEKNLLHKDYVRKTSTNAKAYRDINMSFTLVSDQCPWSKCNWIKFPDNLIRAKHWVRCRGIQRQLDSCLPKSSPLSERWFHWATKKAIGHEQRARLIQSDKFHLGETNRRGRTGPWRLAWFVPDTCLWFREHHLVWNMQKIMSGNKSWSQTESPCLSNLIPSR